MNSENTRLDNASVDNERTQLSLTPEMQQRLHSAANKGANLKRTKAAKSENHRAVALGVAAMGVLAGGGAAAFAYSTTHNDEADNNDNEAPKTEAQPVQQTAAQQPAAQQAEHKDQPAQQQSSDEENVDMEVIAVVHDDESGWNVALVSINGQEAYMIDVDDDNEFDFLLTDTNGDSMYSDNEIVPIFEAHISVNDLGGYTDPAYLAFVDEDYDPNGLNDELAYNNEPDVDYSLGKDFHDDEELVVTEVEESNDIPVTEVNSTDVDVLEVAEEIAVTEVAQSEDIMVDPSFETPIDQPAMEQEIAQAPMFEDPAADMDMGIDMDCSMDA